MGIPLTTPILRVMPQWQCSTKQGLIVALLTYCSKLSTILMFDLIYKPQGITLTYLLRQLLFHSLYTTHHLGIG